MPDHSRYVSGLSSLSTLAKTIAVPHDHPPTRLPSFPNLERTCVMQYLVNTTVDTTGSASSAFALCRSPTYPVWGTVNITSPTLIVSTIELMMKDIAGGGDYVFPNVFETWSGAPSSSYPLGYGGQRSWAYHPDAGVSALRATFEPTLSETRLRITYEL